MVDADRIQDYIFAPHRLKLIRGGSAILRDLNHYYLLQELQNGRYGSGNLKPHHRREELLPTDASLEENNHLAYEVVYAAGGNIYALFREAGLAHSFADRAGVLFRQWSGSATATYAVVPHGGDFRETFENGLAALGVRKTAAAQASSPTSTPYWKSCEACGREPAGSFVEEPGGGQSLLCNACLKRTRNSQKSLYLAEISDTLGVKLGAANDLEQLAEASRPDGYLALLYIDVDSLGKYFDQLYPFTVKNYRGVSQSVKDAVEKAALESCKRVCRGLAAEATAPFEILLMGGDDALILLQPQYVHEFLRWFRKVFNQLAPCAGVSHHEKLTFSVGVVFAHHHLPIAQFVHHAKILLKSAKAAGPGHCDYFVVTESMVSGIEERDTARTMKPYSLADFLWFWRTVAHWKSLGFPSGRAHQLYRAAYEAEQQGTFDYLCLLSRLQSKHRALALRMFRNGFWQNTPRRATRGADIAELWDFVKEP